jgi:hypothetical protein
MRSTRSRVLAAIVGGTLLLAPLAGCGSSDKGKADSSSASSSANGSTAGDKLTKDTLVSTMVAAMREKKTAHMVLAFGSSMGAEADVRYSDSATDMFLTMNMGAMKATMILVDGVMYMDNGSGMYRKIDKNDPSMGSLVSQITGFSPEGSITAMKDGLKKVEYAGTDTVDGVEVSKYHVTVDTAVVAKSLGTSADTASLPKTVTYDMYVDKDNLLRKIEMSISGQEIVITVSKWGEPVEIKAPPASKVQAQ